ncbi:hypothetical protein [Cryobacterium sp. PH31-O1]|uniref:hypothetical protein n=1 Tax=Cryobacterium sp. PH31-O1 TaxID=3046306 RepID=UPI0024BA366A|nr:hypothetical protein [Cryobacterium sp. PH31-O1]MDJ0338131.1 hypothetical protein [Cryobacterium sp. PH31-O1]
MFSTKLPRAKGRAALGTLIIGVVVMLIWPIVTAIFVRNSHALPETCASVYGKGVTVRYDSFPPRQLCETVHDGWVATTDPQLTIGLSAVLVLAVAAVVVGIVVGVRAVPRTAPAASGVNFAYIAGSLPSLTVRRLRRLCGLLAVVSVLSPAWMFGMAIGAAWDRPGAVDPAAELPGYVAQVLGATVIPVLALAVGVAGWVAQVRQRTGGRGSTSDALVVLIAPLALLGLTLALGLGSIAKTIRDGELFVPATTDSAQSSTPPAGDVQLVLPPGLPPIELPDVPSTALTSTQLEQQFAAFVAQTTSRFGPAFEEPERQGAIPGAALDLAVVAAPYAFDCLGSGIGYGMELTFSGADTDDWDVNYDAAAAAFLRITDGWADDGYPSQTYNSEFLAYADEPSVVSQLRARHIGSTVRVGLQSLCVAR